MSGRTLEFVVEKQRLKRNRKCDFSGLIAGSVGYLQAKFEFSSEWDDCIKIATFWFGDQSQSPVTLKNDNSCVIPTEALVGDCFRVSVMGGKPNYRIETNKVKVKQEVI